MKRNYFLIIVFIFLSAIAARSQTDAFTYQGRLTDSMSSGSGIYLMKFELFSDAAGNNLVDVLTDVPVSVSNNVFTVNLNFTAANAFDGGNRFLKISVKRSSNEIYTPLNPLQPITSTPYSIKAKNATTATNALNVGGTPAAQIVKDDDVRLTDSRNPLAGSSNYVQNTATQQIGTTNFNISGIGAANSFNAATGFSIGGSRVLRVGNSADNNLFVGLNAGTSQNLTGSDNAFVGAGAGQNNTTGGGNAFFGSAAGETNTTGGGNTFVGREAGRYSTGADNTFIGSGAGYNNSTGSKNTALGENAQVGGGLTFATVIGAGATVSDSNSVVLGRTADTVRIPGNLNLTGTFSGNFTVPASNVTGTFSQTQIPNLDAGKITSGTLDAARIPNLGASYIQNTTTQQTGNFNLSGNGTLGGTLSGGTVNAQTGFNIGGARVLSVAGTNNAFAGINAGAANTSGNSNSFFGANSGLSNTSGIWNSFFGFDAGRSNVNGNYNAFFGLNAGRLNNESGVGGNENVFFGVNAGTANTTGTGNSFFGTAAGFNNKFGNYNTLLGWNANVSTNNLTYASAVGAGATVSQNDSIVLGKTAGTYNGIVRPADTVRIPGDVIVGGSVKLGVTGNQSAISGEENLRVARGHIQVSAGNATIISGTGYTVTRHSTGVFTIAFTTPFTGDIVLTPSFLNAAPLTAVQTYISESEVRINVYALNGAPTDPLSLLFIAVGIR